MPRCSGDEPAQFLEAGEDVTWASFNDGFGRNYLTVAIELGLVEVRPHAQLRLRPGYVLVEVMNICRVTEGIRERTM